MAQATLSDSRMQLEFDAGVDPEGNQITKRKSFNNVKVSAIPDQLYNIATALAPLQQYPLVLIERDNTKIITA
jgi:hypothetical protein